ncbi:hypothetical protein ACFRCG_29105 [Embleya sp. NPDC056575]|uniref:hypothetical protein n=1 Tax=unclassified Embleya TaxID=2699296 RepID=UPI0036894655
MSARHTLLPRPARIALARDPRLGGGNLWRIALEHSRAPDAPLLVSDPPLVVGDGTPRREFGIAALDALAEAWACHYLDRGVRPRDRVAVYLNDSFEDHSCVCGSDLWAHCGQSGTRRGCLGRATAARVARADRRHGHRLPRGYRAMDERSALKVLVTPTQRPGR